MTDGIETKIFGSGISLLLIVLYLEVRDLTKKTERLEQQLSHHIAVIERKAACYFPVEISGD